MLMQHEPNTDNAQTASSIILRRKAALYRSAPTAEVCVGPVHPTSNANVERSPMRKKTMTRLGQTMLATAPSSYHQISQAPTPAFVAAPMA